MYRLALTLLNLVSLEETSPIYLESTRSITRVYFVPCIIVADGVDVNALLIIF